MSDKSFDLEIVTPQKSFFSGAVDSFSAPGTAGGFQVLHDHAPLLTTIAVGEVKFQDDSDKESICSTSGGFVEVSNNVVRFLAETIEPKEEIDVARAKRSKERAEERLSKNEPGTDLKRARSSLARALNRLRVAGSIE